MERHRLRQYFIHLKTQRRFARQTSTQAICAIKYFWEKTLQRPWPAEVQFARATPQFKLPVVLIAAEVRRIIGLVPAVDHRVALTTIYSCGLRLGEGLALEVGDVDAGRMLLHIRAGKGNRDRCVLHPGPWRRGVPVSGLRALSLPLPFKAPGVGPEQLGLDASVACFGPGSGGA